ncbi:MAG: hypothetical protein IJU23_01900 [Proteobacteria bacterium]|nr:hypothetical protein [Pseudomonadota bacterium]
MKKEISAILDKVLSQGMKILESEKASQILSSPQAQKAMEVGLSALNKAQAMSDCFKAGLADKLGLATRREVEELRETLAKLESEKAMAEAAAKDAADAEAAEKEDAAE